MGLKRSLYKGPYVSWSVLRHFLRSKNLKTDRVKKPVNFLVKNPKLENEFINKKQGKKSFKIWNRSSTILPSFVGYNFQVHNGKTFVEIHVIKEMIGHKFGEFAITRKTGEKIKKKKKK